MLNCKDIKEQLTTNDIIRILELLGSTSINDENEQYLTSETICHHGDSHKLYYYKDTKRFQCYTNCGCMDIFTLIQQSKNVELQEAIRWISENVNLTETHTPTMCITDWNFIKGYKKSHFEVKEFEYYPTNILNTFQKAYYKGWLDEHISLESMKKYDIMYCAYNQQIIIPHYDINCGLIGIRVRNLNYESNSSPKYAPFYDGLTMYNHSLGGNLYGLHKNKNCIKNSMKVMLVESEKSVLQCDTYFGEKNFSLALCGSNLTKQQIKILRDLGVNKVILALDKQYKHVGDDEYVKWIEHLKQMKQSLIPYFNVKILLDLHDDLNYKDSPTDKGKDTLLKILSQN
jgi:hypothetical protein